MAGSRAILRRDYGVPVNNFCYPSGRYDATVIAAVRAAGYAGATTEIPGFADREHPYELKRLEILGSTGVSGLASALRRRRPDAPKSVPSQPDGDAVGGHPPLRLVDREGAVVEDRGAQHGVGAAL